MNSSNSNVNYFNSEAKDTNEIVRENLYFLCTKDNDSRRTRLIRIGARLDDCNRNIPNSQHCTTQDKIDDWINEMHNQNSIDSFDQDFTVLKNDLPIKSLFSRSRSFDGESADNIDGISILNSKSIQACEAISPNTSQILNQDSNFERQDLKKHFQNSARIEHKSNLVRKDTRQNLVDQMTEEIRKKIEEEIANALKNDNRNLIKPEEFMYVNQCNSIGVSTDSELNILPKVQSYKGSREHLVEVIDLNHSNYIEAPQNYSVMSVDTSQRINPKTSDEFSGKKPASGVDEYLQQVMETVMQSGVNTTPTITEDKYFYKMLREKFSKMPPNKLEQILSSICSADESTISDEDDDDTQSGLQPEQTKNDYILISNSSRASYNPPSSRQIATIPNPQFQLIATPAKPVAQIVDATTLQIPRSPVICPISSCQQACFVSDLTRHIAVDHTNVPMERIIPWQCKNFFLDPKLIHFGSNRCQMLLLVKDKIRNLGHEKFKDFIPVLVMSTKVSAFELCCNKSQSQSAVSKLINGGFLMIWLTGLMPPQVPIFFSLTVWARTGNMPSCHIVQSGQLYSIRNAQNATQIQESGQRLLLSQIQVDLLTNNGRNMLELQIAIN